MFKSSAFAVLALSFLSFFRPFLRPAAPALHVAGSVVRITSDQSKVCTGFVVAPQLVLTAAHCLDPDMKADGTVTSVVKTDGYFDLLLLRALDVHKDAVTFRDTPVFLLENLVALGYGNGWTTLLMLKESVVIVSYPVTPDSPVGIIVQEGYVPGMSGGPLIDLDGRVVGIIQQANGHLGYGVGTQIIKAFLLDARANLQ
jgi:S1-C subfamily serine protease